MNYLHYPLAPTFNQKDLDALKALIQSKEKPLMMDFLTMTRFQNLLSAIIEKFMWNNKLCFIKCYASAEFWEMRVKRITNTNKIEN